MPDRDDHADCGFAAPATREQTAAQVWISAYSFLRGTP